MCRIYDTGSGLRDEGWKLKDFGCRASGGLGFRFLALPKRTMEHRHTASLRLEGSALSGIKTCTSMAIIPGKQS